MSTYTRWSGDIRIRVHLRDDNSYRCALRVLGADGEACMRAAAFVYPAPSDGVLDSPTQIDSVAHAALSFAEHDGASVSEHAHHTDTGWHIGRTYATRW